MCPIFSFLQEECGSSDSRRREKSAKSNILGVCTMDHRWRWVFLIFCNSLIFPGIFDTACQKKGFLWCLLQMIFLGEMDRHWNPYYIHCNLCHTKYTAVIKWEIVCWYFEKINYKSTRYEVYCGYKVRGFASWYLKESNNRMTRTGLNIWTQRRKCSSLG